MTRPVQLATGVWRIPTVGSDLVNSFAFEEPDGSLTLVDTGIKRVGPRNVVRGLAAMGRRPDEVHRILLTHAHFDHAGGAAGVVRRTGAALLAHEEEAQWPGRGRTPPMRRVSLLRTVLDATRPKLEKVEVGSTFREGDLLDVAGGLRVLHTPGHTAGHCSFLHEPTGVLITGDSLFNWFDRMAYSYALFCSDVPLSRQTADRLAEVDYEVAAFTHGPEIRDRAREKVREFLRAHTRPR